MKAAAFDYVRPTTLGEACGYLADAGVEARVIAGGQSLVPMMAMRLVRPGLLVDVNDIDSLSGIARDGDTMLYLERTLIGNVVSDRSIRRMQLHMYGICHL
jgi:CO/xanthine dehydrogenase FAD-binding subunit